MLLLNLFYRRLDSWGFEDMIFISRWCSAIAFLIIAKYMVPTLCEILEVITAFWSRSESGARSFATTAFHIYKIWTGRLLPSFLIFFLRFLISYILLWFTPNQLTLTSVDSLLCILVSIMDVLNRFSSILSINGHLHVLFHFFVQVISTAYQRILDFFEQIIIRRLSSTGTSVSFWETVILIIFSPFS